MLRAGLFKGFAQIPAEKVIAGINFDGGEPARVLRFQDGFQFGLIEALAFTRDAPAFGI